MKDGFNFYILVRKCETCPYIEYMPYGASCELDNLQRFIITNDKIIDKNCPFRKKHMNYNVVVEGGC